MEITDKDRAEYPHHTDKAILGIKYAKSLSDAQICVGIKEIKLALPGAPKRKGVFKRFMDFMGEGTNPYWVAGRIAEEAYARNLISTNEFAYLTE